MSAKFLIWEQSDAHWDIPNGLLSDIAERHPCAQILRIVRERRYSPLQDQHPDAGVDVLLRELLRLSVSLSDNVAADILLRLVCGPKAVNTYIAALRVSGFHLQDSEAVLHHEVSAQYRNWFEPAGAVQLLRRISDNSPLTSKHTDALGLDDIGPSDKAPGG